MKLDKQKIMLAMANACMDQLEMCDKAEITYMTLQRIFKGYGCKPSTAGKIAHALGVRVEDIIKDE